ncbi:MAG: SBBP repeat-containing protein, partial [Planctomycetes bacterium]|nr:SBBP repeat-containing protein [Planctomycetota bacterium]
MKLDPATGLLWTAQYGGRGSQVPGAFAVDAVGNIYLTGGDGGDVLTVNFVAPDARAPFLRGESNGDGAVDMSDAMSYFPHLSQPVSLIFASEFRSQWHRHLRSAGRIAARVTLVPDR